MTRVRSGAASGVLGGAPQTGVPGGAPLGAAASPAVGAVTGGPGGDGATEGSTPCLVLMCKSYCAIAAETIGGLGLVVCTPASHSSSLASWLGLELGLGLGLGLV